MQNKGEWNPGKGFVDDRLLALETRTNEGSQRRIEIGTSSKEEELL
jgi:hypothetical protein